MAERQARGPRPPGPAELPPGSVVRRYGLLRLAAAAQAAHGAALRGGGAGHAAQGGAGRAGRAGGGADRLGRARAGAGGTVRLQPRAGRWQPAVQTERAAAARYPRAPSGAHRPRLQRHLQHAGQELPLQHHQLRVVRPAALPLRHARAQADGPGRHAGRGGAAAGHARLHAALQHRRAGGPAAQVEGNGFLYKMVRHIAGVLVAIGEGRLAAGALSDMLETGADAPPGLYGKYRGYNVAPAKGLCLHEVRYDPRVDDPAALLYPGLLHDQYGRLLEAVPGTRSDEE